MLAACVTFHIFVPPTRGRYVWGNRGCLLPVLCWVQVQRDVCQRMLAAKHKRGVWTWAFVPEKSCV